MGTRADFYKGGTDPSQMVWLGSVAWDGYPEGVPEVLGVASEDEWVVKVLAFLADRPDATAPEQGWPWPWEDSRTTDYAYTWTPEGVRASQFGHAWFDPLDPAADHGGVERGDKVAFPDMTAVQNVVLGPRSGLIVLGMDPPPE